jgi:hypothetical protein
MKAIIFLIIGILSVLTNAQAEANSNKACFRLVSPGDHQEWGALCIKTPVNNRFFNTRLSMSIYKGEELIHTLEGKSGELILGRNYCGGKEHDCWYIPTHFSAYGEDSDYKVFLNLNPLGPTVNSCVRCSSSRLYITSGTEEVSLRVE